MNKIIILLTIFLLLPYISAEIIFEQQPKNIYNLGDVVSIPVTLQSSTDFSGNFKMDLLCNGKTIPGFYTNGVALTAGEPKSIEAILVLNKDIIGETTGECKVVAYLGQEAVSSSTFRISNLIKINTTFETLEFAPGENIIIEGMAVKENGKDVNGFIEFSIVEGNSSILSQLDTINNGFFSLNITFPNDMKAEAYLVKLNAHEENTKGEITNKGFINQNILIKQIPTSLEIVFENPGKVVEPGTSLKVKTVLHDQTGEKIESTSSITIKNQNDKILEQQEIATDEFLEFPIDYNEPPSTWKVVATSNELSAQSTFQILEKEDIEIEIVNRTLTITNIGNVPYNKTALVKIGNESLNIDVYLEVDESQKYLLTAPDGQYKVEVITDGETAEAELSLTGKSIDVKKASGKIGSLVKYPLAWIFVILILGFITFIVFKKGYQKSFIGYISSKAKKSGGSSSTLTPLTKKSLVNSRNRAILSLSIKGERQNVSVLALHIKNLKEIQTKKGNTEETLQKVVNTAEEHKAVTYEDHNTLFFIFAPIKTKTFGNETIALKTAQEIKLILTEYNRMFKQKIDFGISLNYGTIIAKQDPSSSALKFMSMGTLMASAKKISAMTHNDILLGEKIADRLRSHVKATRHEKKGTKVYSIKEIKNVDEHKKFLRGFLERIEKDDKSREESKEEEK